MVEVTLCYTEPLLKRAVRCFVFRAIGRQLGPLFFVAVAILIGCLVFMLAKHDRGWAVGFIIATILFVAVFFAAIYVAHYRNTLGRFRQMKNPEARLSLGDAQFTLTSELGSATMPWSAITEIWQYPDFWLLLFSKSQFSVLPLGGIDEKVRAFITERAGKQNA
jgi:hypothetical protein